MKRMSLIVLAFIYFGFKVAFGSSTNEDITCPKINEMPPNVETDTPSMNATNLANGTKITFTCKDGKDLVNRLIPSKTLATLNINCGDDGHWSKNVNDYLCLECDKIQPRNGEILCVSSYSETASTCHFECPDGLVPGYKRRTSCKAKVKKTKDDKNVVSHYWTEDVNNFECVSTISMVIGGIDNKNSYLNDVELYAPNRPCHQVKLTQYPLKVAGATGNLIGNGEIVVCGGAVATYSGCSGNNRKKKCERNIECVETKGGGKWCFGPRTKDCYNYQPNRVDPNDRWRKVALLKTPRVFASSVVLPDGRLWILGGLGVDSILKTTEIITPPSMEPFGRWKVTRGPDLPLPLFGHCVLKLSNGKIMLSGGFNGEDQVDIGKEFEWKGDLVSGKWTSKPWSGMKSKRYDHTCFSSEKVMYVAGGWRANYNGKLKTERFNVTSRRWSQVDVDPLSTDIDSELPDILRSASVGVSENKIALIGGLSCEVLDETSGNKKCTKDGYVYELGFNQERTALKWKKTDFQIGLPRSSHLTIVVPRSIHLSCQATNN